MAKRGKKTKHSRSLQAVTLCISTAMVLILVGMVVFSVLTAHNLSRYVKENFVVTKLSTTGGFLKIGNTTFLIGTEEEITCQKALRKSFPVYKQRTSTQRTNCSNGFRPN
mgnify:CR=1 FL=1